MVEIQISLAKIHMQPSKNEGLLPMIFHFKGWFFKLFLLALHFSRMGEGHFTEKNGDRNFFRSNTWLFLGEPQESLKSLTLGRECNDLEEMLRCQTGDWRCGMTISIGKRK